MKKVLLQQGPSLWHPASRWGDRACGVRMPLLGMALIATWSGTAGAAVQPQPAPSSAHAFNFAYRSEGARNAAPTQVFDDGRRTYMQFNALDRVPELWTDESSGQAGSRRLAFHLESSYVVIDQVLPRLRLVIDGENTVLVNQGWAARPAARAPVVARATQPRIWTDSTPFGPDEPPGPVATSRAARPSHEIAGRRVALPATAPSAAADSVAPSRAPGLAVSEENSEETGVNEPAAVMDTDTALAKLNEPGELTREAFADTRLELMRAQAQEMILRAHQAGDARAELRLRRIFSEVARTPVDAGAHSQVLPPGRRPDGVADARSLLALADTRPRSDAPLRDEDGEDAAAAQDPAAPGRARQPAMPADPLDVGTATASQAAVPAGSASLVFEVRDNQRLSQALARFLETLGWRLEWESQSDFVVRRGYVVKAPTLKAVLLQTLGEYRLSATLYSGNLVVMVSGGER